MSSEVLQFEGWRKIHFHYYRDWGVLNCFLMTLMRWHFLIRFHLLLLYRSLMYLYKFDLQELIGKYIREYLAESLVTSVRRELMIGDPFLNAGIILLKGSQFNGYILFWKLLYDTSEKKRMGNGVLAIHWGQLPR